MGLEQRSFGVAHFTQQTGSLHIRHHQRERFGLAMFALPQSLYSFRIQRVTRKMIPSQSLNGKYRTLRNILCRHRDRIGLQMIWTISLIKKAHLWAASGAGVWLGMKAPIEWVSVFCFAGWTHGKNLHGRLFTVIRDILHNSETWSAIGTVDKGITVTPISRIK